MTHTVVLASVLEVISPPWWAILFIITSESHLVLNALDKYLNLSEPAHCHSTGDVFLLQDSGLSKCGPVHVPSAATNPS